MGNRKKKRTGGGPKWSTITVEKAAFHATFIFFVYVCVIGYKDNLILHDKIVVPNKRGHLYQLSSYPYQHHIPYTMRV